MFGNLFKLSKSAARKADEAVEDKFAIELIEQDIEDAKKERKSAKETLSNLIAKLEIAKEDAAELEASLAKYEGYADEADDAGNEDLFNDCCERIASIEIQLNPKRDAIAFLEAEVAKGRKAVTTADNRIERKEQELDGFKTVNDIQKLQEQTAGAFDGNDSSLASADERMARLKERQRVKAAKIKANESLADTANDLDARLAAAGIGDNRSSSANSVAARLRAKKAG